MEVRERLPCVHCMLWCMQCTHHLLTFLVLMLCWSKWYLSQHQQQETNRHGRSFCCSGCFCLCCRCCSKKKKLCRIVRKNVPARWIQKELHGVILWCAGKNEKILRTDVQPSARNAQKKNSVNKEKLSRTNVQPSAQNAHKKNSVNKEKCR